MKGPNYIADILILFLVTIGAAQNVDTATVSITGLAAFSVQPACVQSCVFYNSFDVADYLVFELGCTSTIYNECYCTQIQDKSASTALSTCVNTLCKGTTEISNAISLYESYCNGAGYPRTVSASQTSTTTSSSTPASTTPSSTTPTTTPTSSSSSTAASSTPSSSSPSSTPPPSTTTSSTESSSGTSTSTPSPSQSSKNDASSIAGSHIGALFAGLILVAGLIYAW
ncbi:hypothetical protein OIDMADRAFT_148728 [Oidiodendron maius Zn]|uniref:CFEM domain-containing protein n=1 Tax=Oidiodendron maius (strain Zn) TaxID=913774 RepID=A0A0C3D183_OIDMZ|nr:hypothetical protein OIDMADRAFT_148728 [Oidiodendron maius Zn]